MKKLIALLFVTILSLSLVACKGNSEPSEIDEQNVQQQTDEIQSSDPSDSDPVEDETLKITDNWADGDEGMSSSCTVTTEPYEPNSAATDTEADNNADDQIPQDSEIAKINGGADEVGIYSVVVRLTDQAADKGVVEMVYYGAKGSPQENSIVNTFRIEYYKEEAGTFEIQTFFNGEVYQNQHHKDEVKVVNTFDATLRAGSVIITYTPDGGESQEIFSADADYFNTSSN